MKSASPFLCSRFLLPLCLALAGGSTFAQTNTNLPAFLSLAYPADTTVFEFVGTNTYLPDMPMVVLAFDPEFAVSAVTFYANSKSLGVVTNAGGVNPPGSTNPPVPYPIREFEFFWTNVPVGAYSLSASALLTNGTTISSSNRVEVTVRAIAATPPPLTNLMVRITSPHDGATLRSPLNLPISASAFPSRGTFSVTSVDFYSGTNHLGTGRSVFPILPGRPFGGPYGEYELTWTNPAAGSYSLTAIAHDAVGLSATSSPVNITILPPPPPPTNVPPSLPIVNIVATDPLAISGTNCWTYVGVVGAPPTWTNWQFGGTLFGFLTNCGPSDAVFAVNRFGSTNNPLTVTYRIGGTASNGVDYATLPGSITIPAGQESALITVAPTGTATNNLTVTLSLTSASANPGGYKLGFPAQASALIVNSTNRPPRVGPLAGQFHFSQPGPDDAWFRIDCATNMLGGTNWVPLCTNQVVHGWIDFVDPDSSTNVHRFYRVVPQGNPK